MAAWRCEFDPSAPPRPSRANSWSWSALRSGLGKGSGRRSGPRRRGRGVRERRRRWPVGGDGVEEVRVVGILAAVSGAAAAAANSSCGAATGVPKHCPSGRSDGRSRRAWVTVSLRSKFTRGRRARSTGEHASKIGASYIDSGGGAGAAGAAGKDASHLPPRAFLPFLYLMGRPEASILSLHAGTAQAA